MRMSQQSRALIGVNVFICSPAVLITVKLYRLDLWWMFVYAEMDEWNFLDNAWLESMDAIGANELFY